MKEKVSKNSENLQSGSGGHQSSLQFKDKRSESSRQKSAQDLANQAVQRKENKTGMPDQLKAGLEQMSGMDMGDVKVHYNSSQPSQLNAHAFAQGSNIHLAPGQERHLPHEAWHVVQQKQGRVKPTKQIQGNVNVNDDKGLEREADVMGSKAYQFKSMDDVGFEGVEYAQMSTDDYSSWKDTIQGKFLHGTADLGNGQMVVTQFQENYDVYQLFGWDDFKAAVSAGLSPKTKGVLLITEGVLTIAAGGAAIGLTAGAGIIPGILAIGAGIFKVARGALTYYEIEGDDADAKERRAIKTHIVDLLRGLEGTIAIIGGGIVGNPAAIVFGIAKTLRAILTAITNYMGKDTEYPLARKVLMSISSALHYVEVGAGIAAGVNSLGKVGADGATDADNHIHKAVAAGFFMTSGTKAGRATDNAREAIQSPSKKEGEDESETASSSSSEEMSEGSADYSRYSSTESL